MKVNSIFYAAGRDLQNTIRMCIILKEPVDSGALKNAVQKAAVRFPYFCVRLARKGEEYVLEENSLPFVVSEGGKTVALGSSQSNGHLFAFACDGCRLYIDSVHFLTDGNGIFPFVKTLLYYYLSEVHPEEEFDIPKTELAGSPIPGDEACDSPYPKEPLKSTFQRAVKRPEEVFVLKDQPQGYSGMDGWTSFRFRIHEKELMSFVSGVDGSPASFIAALMYKVIDGLHPENDLPLVCGMQHQFRAALGRPHSHMCHVSIVPVVYPKRVRKMNIEQLNTVTRGILILGAGEDSDILTVNRHIQSEAQISGMSLEEKRGFMRDYVLCGIGKNTYEVSYTGRVLWSGLDRYVAEVIPYLDMTLSGGISVEIFSVAGLFCINIMQRNSDALYAKRFAALLSENGIGFESEEGEHFSLCSLSLPE